MNIDEIVKLDNVVPHVKEDELALICSRVLEEFEIDKASMSDWMGRNEVARKLIDPKLERKTDPFDGAANTKLPLVLNAAMKASAEEIAEILRGKELVKTEIFGSMGDPARAAMKTARSARVTKRMNYQYEHVLEEWAEDHDKLILAKNIYGTVHKKYVWCKSKNRIECVLRRNGVTINDNVEHLSDAPRITDEIEKFWWECEEKFRSGEWTKMDIPESESPDWAKSDKVNPFLEQLRREDLDGDGYPEPYVVTVHVKTKKVVCIVPNFTPDSIEKDEKGNVTRIDLSRTRIRYVKYEMIPSFEGGYWSPGWGILLSPLNDNCNALINQMIDAGTMTNRGGGFFSSALRMGQGAIKFKWNEWKPVNAPGIDFKNSFYEMPKPQVSQTSFHLLGLLMDVLRELSSVTEVMSGEQPHANMAQGTIQSLIEQGKKVFNSIYKRHYTSLSKEFVALFDLNYLYEDPAEYMKFTDMTLEMLVAKDPNLMPQTPEEAQQLAMAYMQGDFERVEIDILPTANPEFSSRLERIQKAQALFGMGGPGMPPPPELNRALVVRMLAEAITDDSDLAKQLVPDDPIKTHEQIMQEMDQMKQQVMDSSEVKALQAKEQIAVLELRIKQIEHQKVSVEAPAKAAAAESKADQADLNAAAAAAQIDLANKKIEQLEAQIKNANEMADVEKELKKAEADLARAEASALKKESERSPAAA